uniref:Uncharacterized protein n=1 Tax=Ciona intestinalis TaxID=7719 RepID=H2XK35_CIOIN
MSCNLRIPESLMFLFNMIFGKLWKKINKFMSCH